MTTLKLSCDDFHGKLSAGLLSMLESEQLVNVTIAVDGRFLKAHKMVLSICSSYFKTLLETNPCKHPIIFMKDVKYHIMKHLLRFMYEGEAQIDAEEFQIFIDTAQALQIKWLTSETNENSENTQKPLLQPELSQQVITSKSTKRPFKPDTKTPESTKPNTFGIVQQEPLIMIHETGSNVTEQIAKRSKILSEHIAIDQPSSSSSIDNLHIHVDNKIGNVVVVNETSIREQMPPSGGISNEGSTSVAEHRIFEHRLNVLQSFDGDSSYRDEISVKEETKDVVDKDGDDDYEDELLDQLPNMSAYLESASPSDVPNMHLPETSTSMQVSTQQEGEPVKIKFLQSDNKKKTTIVVYNNYRYWSIGFTAATWTRWRCARQIDNCHASIILTQDRRLLIPHHEHNHLQDVINEISVTFLKTTRKRKGKKEATIVIYNNHRYFKSLGTQKSSTWTRWRCARCFNQNKNDTCHAAIIVTQDHRLLIQNHQHNHVPEVINEKTYINKHTEDYRLTSMDYLKELKLQARRQRRSIYEANAMM